MSWQHSLLHKCSRTARAKSDVKEKTNFVYTLLVHSAPDGFTDDKRELYILDEALPHVLRERASAPSGVIDDKELIF